MKYNAIDADANGIAEFPYTITGSAGRQDNFPLMKCPHSQTGGISIELIIIISSISGAAVIGVAATIILIQRKRKRIQ